EPFFPKCRGKPRVDDRRVLRALSSSGAMTSGGEQAHFARMMAGPAGEAAVPKTVMIDAPTSPVKSRAESPSSTTGAATQDRDLVQPPEGLAQGFNPARRCAKDFLSALAATVMF